MDKKMYLLEDLYVVMYMLRNNTMIDNSYGNLGMYCKVCINRDKSYYLIDGGSERLITFYKALNGKFYDSSENMVALVSLSKDNSTYNQELPYIGGKDIKFDIKEINGKLYVDENTIFNIKNEYNRVLNIGVNEDIKYFKNRVKDIKIKKGKR